MQSLAACGLCISPMMLLAEFTACRGLALGFDAGACLSQAETGCWGGLVGGGVAGSGGHASCLGCWCGIIWDCAVAVWDCDMFSAISIAVVDDCDNSCGV